MRSWLLILCGAGDEILDNKFTSVCMSVHVLFGFMCVFVVFCIYVSVLCVCVFARTCSSSSLSLPCALTLCCVIRTPHAEMINCLSLC